MALHDAQEFDDNLRGWSDEDLALATALGIDNVVQAVILGSINLRTKYNEDQHSRGQRCGPF